MTSRRSFLLRVTALITAFALIFTGIIGYTSAATDDEKQHALPLDSSCVTDFYIYLKDSSGKGVMVGTKQNAQLEVNDSDKLRAEEITYASLNFKWKSKEFSSDQLKACNGLLVYDIGTIAGLDFTGAGTDESNAIVSGSAGNSASYWIEDGKLYIRLEEGAFDKINHSGGITFEGELNREEVSKNQGKLTVGRIEYQFDTSSRLGLYVNKTAPAELESRSDGYYQKFQVVVGSVYGSVSDVVLTDVLGEWFDGTLYDVTISKPGGGTENLGNITGNPVTINIGNTPNNEKTWPDYDNAVTVTYYAKFDSSKVNMAQLLENKDGDRWKNTVKATSGDLESNESSAWVSVQRPHVRKTGTLSADGTEIIWRIYVKTTSLSGNTFQLFDDFISGTDYINLKDYEHLFENGYLTQDNLKTDPNTGERYLEFRTPVTSTPWSKTTVTNKATVKFPDGATFEASADVVLSPPASEKNPKKTLVDYEIYDPLRDKAGYYNNGKHYNIFYWQIDYVLTEDDFTISGSAPLESSGIGGWENGGWIDGIFIQDRVSVGEILKGVGDIVIKDDKNHSIDYNLYNPYEAANQFSMYVDITKAYDGYTLKPGDTIHIKYMSVVDEQKPVSEITNYVYRDWGERKDEITQPFPTFTTDKQVYSNTQSNDKKCTVDWIVYVQSTDGFQPGDHIEITDVLPEGLSIIDSSIEVGYQWIQFLNEGVVKPFIDGTTDSTNVLDVEGWDYFYSKTADGRKQYKFQFTLPKDWVKYGYTYQISDKTLYVALKYTTELDKGVYEDVLSGKIAGFTNYASATVTRDSVERNTNEDPETFIPDPNIDGKILNKEALTSGLTGNNGETIPYKITVNENKQQLLSDGGKLILTDTLGNRLYLDKESVEVYVNDGTTPDDTVKWDYDEALRKLTFELDDATKYTIAYNVNVDYPNLQDDPDWNEWEHKGKDPDFYNTATLIIESNSITSVEKGEWVQKASASYNNETVITKDVDLTITKKWEGTSDYVHNVWFKVSWVKYTAEGVYESESSKTVGGSNLYPIKTNGKSWTATTPLQLTAVETEENGTIIYYYVYTLKEAYVDDNSYVYDVSGWLTGVVGVT